MAHIDYLEEHRRRRSLKKRLKWYVRGFLLCAVVISGAVIFFKAPIFAITSLEVKGITDPEARAALLNDIRTRVGEDIHLPFLALDHYFAWPDALSYSSSEIKNITIEKQFLAHRIVITAHPREPFGIWCFGNGEGMCVWVDKEDGVVMEQAAKPSGTLVITLYDNRETAPEQGDRVIAPEYLGRITNLISAIKKEGIGFSHFRVDTVNEEMVMERTSGTLIRFNLREGGNAAPAAALAALAKQSSLDAFASVDLTVENRVYVVRR